LSAASGIVTTTAASLGSSRLDRSREQFKQAVLEGQIRRKQNQGNLEDAKKANDAAALRTTAIGVCSAYRDYDGDATAWSDTFDKHYEKEGNRVTMEAMPGGRHGDTALRWFIELMAPIKAPPGFSNHSNGLAVDFSTTVSGVTYGADTDRRVQWRGTWLHPWLVANAKTYRFNPLSSEEWHWDWA